MTLILRLKTAVVVAICWWPAGVENPLRQPTHWTESWFYNSKCCLYICLIIDFLQKISKTFKFENQMRIARTKSHMIDSSMLNQKNILNLANRMPARQKLIFTPTSDSTNFALSHAERVPNMDLSFRLESSELCWKDTHTILNKNLKCLRLGSARPFSFMLFVVCSMYYIATQWCWILWV